MGDQKFSNGSANVILKKKRDCKHSLTMTVTNVDTLNKKIFNLVWEEEADITT